MDILFQALKRKDPVNRIYVDVLFLFNIFQINCINPSIRLPTHKGTGKFQTSLIHSASFAPASHKGLLQRNLTTWPLLLILTVPFFQFWLFTIIFLSWNQIVTLAKNNFMLLMYVKWRWNFLLNTTRLLRCTSFFVYVHCTLLNILQYFFHIAVYQNIFVFLSSST